MKRASVGILLLMALGFTGRTEEKGTFTVVDDRGVEVSFLRSPERVVSLVPSVTEVTFALGAQGKLVGVTTFCDYPPEAKAMPKVGDFSNPSLERICSLKPEVVFVTMPEQNSIAQKLQNLGLRVFCIQPESIEGTLSSVEKVGAVLRETGPADSLVTHLRAGLAHISRLVADVERVEVYVEIAANPLITATENSFVGELVALAGGQNTARGPEPYMVINSERIVTDNPEVILITHPVSTPEEVKTRIGWERIAAVRNDRVHRLDPDLVLRPGPRILDGALEFLKRIHPEIAAEAGE